MTARNASKVDSIDFVRQRVVELRDLELEKEELESRLKEVNAKIEFIAFESLVDVMNEKRVQKIRIDRDGNKPAFDAELFPFYKANIAASWDEDRKLRAFDAVEAHGGSDMIKTVVTFSFPRGEKKQAIKLFNQNKALFPQMAESIPWTTLTSWLRERIEGGLPTPPYDVIGARVGQQVKIKKV